MISSLRGELRARLLLWYDLYGETLRLDRLGGRLLPHPAPVNEEYEPGSIEGIIPGISFLVATTHAGLLLFEGDRCRRLYRGRDFFGLTTRGGRWYAFQRLGIGNGCIFSFRLQDGRAVDTRLEVPGLLRGVHQIDFIDDSLWIVDTFHDRILVVPADALGKDWRGKVTVHHPLGRDGIGRGRPNHAHFNSLLGRAEGVYLIAHYEGAKTGRASELFILDGNGTVLERELLGGSDCHNIAFIGGERLYCRSKEGAVCRGSRDVLRLDGYVRGLALGSDFHVVGTSAVAESRDNRADGDGSVVVTDLGFQPLATAVLPRTQVYEVRRADELDLGFSAANAR